jgi:hypothetical protein
MITEKTMSTIAESTEILKKAEHCLGELQKCAENLHVKGFYHGRDSLTDQLQKIITREKARLDELNTYAAREDRDGKVFMKAAAAYSGKEK